MSSMTGGKNEIPECSFTSKRAILTFIFTIVQTLSFCPSHTQIKSNHTSIKFICTIIILSILFESKIFKKKKNI